METLVPSAPPGLQPALTSLPSSLCPVTCHFLEISFKLQLLLIRGTDSLLQPQPQLTTGPASTLGLYLHTSPPTSLRPGHSALLQREGPPSHRPGTDLPNTQIRDSSCHQKAQAPGRDVHQETLQSGGQSCPRRLAPPSRELRDRVCFVLSLPLPLSLFVSLPPSPFLSPVLPLHTHTLSLLQLRQSGRNYPSKQPDCPSFRKFQAGQGEGPGWGARPGHPPPLLRVLCAHPVQASSRPHTLPGGLSFSTAAFESFKS